MHERSVNGKNWYSGFGDPEGPSNYVPIRNDGAYHIGLQLLGHKPRSTLWAQLILRGFENIDLDDTAPARRALFFRKYRVLSVREEICAPIVKLNDDTSTNSTNATDRRLQHTTTQGRRAGRNSQKLASNYTCHMSLMIVLIFENLRHTRTLQAT